MIVFESAADFKRFEQEIYSKVCEIGCGLMKQALEALDGRLMAERDRAEYRHRGRKMTSLKTVMGTVTYSRSIYEHKIEDGTEYVYLLDEAIGLGGPGLMSANLSELIAKACCDGSYRNAARSLSETTGQSISHTGAWNVVQSLGEGLGAEEKRAAERAKEQKGAGELEAKLLFEEQDGIWLNLQGKSREKYGKSKEMKLAIAYDGAKRIGGKRFELTNKVACANFEEAAKFRARKEGVIADTYNVDEIELRILNGDGASWIKRSLTDETVHFQLDTFHRNQAVMKHVSDPEAKGIILNLLYLGDISALLEVIEAYKNSTSDETEMKNYEVLLEYFRNNKEGLVPYARRGLPLPEPPEGTEYRRLGAMESNIFTILGNRMKGGRACWSVRGANNLARLLCRKFTGGLSKALQKLTSSVLPERFAEEWYAAQEPQILSASKAPAREGKGYNGFHQAEILPAMKWMKNLMSLTPLSDM